MTTATRPSSWCGNRMISNVNELTPDRALIFRLTHADNLSWILDHGLHCNASDVLDPNFVEIGNADLILKRPTRRVPVTPGGTLDHYRRPMRVLTRFAEASFSASNTRPSCEPSRSMTVGSRQRIVC